MWMSYQIGADIVRREPSAVVVFPYGYTGKPHKDGDVQYCNLYDEEDSGRYGPYLPKTDVGEEYGESRPDPKGLGFKRNVVVQLERAISHGFKVVELDNTDGYPDLAVLTAYEFVRQRGLRVWVKNPGQRLALLRHPAAVGIIQENDEDLSPEVMVGTVERARRAAGKPDMSVCFVINNRPKRADAIAAIIRQKKLHFMSVSLGGHNEYEFSMLVQPFI